MPSAKGFTISITKRFAYRHYDSFLTHSPTFFIENSGLQRRSHRRTLCQHRFPDAVLSNPTNIIKSKYFYSSSTYVRKNRMELYRSMTSSPSISTSTSTTASAHKETISSSGASSSSVLKISSTELQMNSDCYEMINAAIDAANPINAVHRHLQVVTNGNNQSLQILGRTNKEVISSYDVQNKYDNIVIVAFGKASSAMATAVLDRLQELDCKKNKISGLVICKDSHCTQSELQYLQQYNVNVREASHPIPDQRSVNASNELLALVKKKCETGSTLVLACISGGGSALFCSPHTDLLSLEDLIVTNSVLLKSGLSILDMNIIRKRLEKGKGGRLAAIAASVQENINNHVVSLILSDVIGDPLDLIASGPTVPDTSTWDDAWKIVQQNEYLQTNLPGAVLQLLEDGVKGKYDNNTNSMMITAPNQSHPIFTNNNSQFCLVGNNAAAVYAAAARADKLGYRPIVLGTQWQGEASHVATVLINLVQHILDVIKHERKEQSNFDDLVPKYSMIGSYDNRPIALIAGGETTVTIPQTTDKDNHSGLGGRNQELALSAGIQLDQLRRRHQQSRRQQLLQMDDNDDQIHIVLASIGTDGTDGPTDAAGAIVDTGTVSRLDSVHKQSNTDSPDSTMTPAALALQQHNSYYYFNVTDSAELGGTGKLALDKRGPTGTNVADIMIVLIERGNLER